jgi:pimeloyl-ACP methyl ester carboxylesterase
LEAAIRYLAVVADATFGSAVLVHGLWGHPEDWQWVAELLDRQGVQVHAPDLPSHSSTTHGLADDAEAVRRVIRSCQAPVVAVGWSYGGDVISMAAVYEPSVCHLVYVSAVPRPRTEERFDVSWLENDPTIHFSADGSYVLDNDLWLTQDDAVKTFHPDVLAHLRRHPRRGVSPGVDDPQTEASWESIPTTVIIGSADDLISADDRAKALEHFEDVQILPTDHFIIFRHPDVVSDAVVHALREGGRSVAVRRPATPVQ